MDCYPSDDICNLTGESTLSAGSILAFGGIVGASLSSPSFGTFGGHVYPTLFAFAAALVSGLLLGMFNGALVAKWHSSICCYFGYAKHGSRTNLYLHRRYADSKFG